MRVRQSDLQMWQYCPLSWKFAKLDELPREQNSALTFGTILHDVVLWLETTRDVESAVARFQELWEDPAKLDPGLVIESWIKGHSYPKLHDDGVRIIRNWWGIIQWEADVVLAREHHFIVPFGDHELEGTLDKLVLRYDPKTDEDIVVISDYKTNAKQPTYNYLHHHLQFTMYAKASTSPEFWTMEHGESYYERTKNLRRFGEWVHLRGPARMNAGERTELHYQRLKYAIDAFAASVALRIFVPNITGESCAWCSFRKVCGLPTWAEEGFEPARNWS